MGNALSEEEENEMLEEAYSMSLESPEADKHLNSGTSAPNCQPKHTTEAQDIKERNSIDSHSEDGGHLKHQRGSSMSDTSSDGERRKRQHTNQNPSAKEQQRKMSYFQMARMGYQELVNAIIRPPRAEYKVSL
jgi:hypothetical protein